LCYVNKSKLNKFWINNILISFTSRSSSVANEFDDVFPISFTWGWGSLSLWGAFAAGVSLVSVPVFFEAPLVRSFPWLSLAFTIVWLALSLGLLLRSVTKFWGDLIFGFTWSWLAGSIYWGWLRWEPLLHLPIEAIGLPVAMVCLWQRRLRIGSLFYLGSLLGTALTDLYFYLVGLIPHWRQLMQVDPDMALPIFQSAIAQIRTPWGYGCAIVLGTTLVVISLSSLWSKQLHWWAFSGAVLGTILVDGLFWLAAATV
jgi:hypothetical protein